MNITYTRSYSNVKVHNVNDLTNVVNSFYCIITGTDSDSGISTPIGVDVILSDSNPDPATFVRFQNLTPAILDAWVDSYVDVNYYQNLISEGISNIVNPPFMPMDLPFSQ